jgi:hypothetical protein
MKAIAIEKLLKGLSDNFLNSIKDEILKEEVKNNFFIAGGCIPSMMLNEFVSDFDIYFTNKETADKIREYYKGNIVFPVMMNYTVETTDEFTKIKYNEEVKKNSFLPIFISPQAITLTDKVQLITKFYGEPKDVVENFDWAHLKSYFKYPKLFINDSTYRLINEKELIYTGSRYPLSSFLRTRKYIKKGWTISAKESLKIALELAKYDLTDLIVLRDQLMGVDPLYMLSVLKEIEGKKWEIDELIEKLDNLKGFDL